MPGHSESTLDELARAAASGISRRRFGKLLGGTALAALTPGWMRTANAYARTAGTVGPRGTLAVKASGTCPSVPQTETSVY
jgi:hypothetical protein